MTSLYNRATSVQERILRIVEGAVRNAAACHSEARFSHKFPRSVAKRAAGTITAQLAVTLAGSGPSDQGGATGFNRTASEVGVALRPALASVLGPLVRAEHSSADRVSSPDRIGRVLVGKARPVSSKKRAMRNVRKEIAILATAARGDPVRWAALNDALAIITGATAADRLVLNEGRQ
jgi:hypothetical protein